MYVEEAAVRVLMTTELGRVFRIPLYQAGYDISVCRFDRNELFRRIEREAPDIVLVSSAMGGMKADCLAKEIKACSFVTFPVLMALFSGADEQEKRPTEAEGVHSVEMAGCSVEKVIAACSDLTIESRLKPDFAADDKISSALKRLGIHEETAGARYLMRVISLCARDQRCFGKMNSTIYPMVASEFGVSTAAVERMIRYSIECAWLTGDMETQYAFFGNTIDASRGKPTNNEFAARVTEALRLEAGRK